MASCCHDFPSPEKLFKKFSLGLLIKISAKHLFEENLVATEAEPHATCSCSCLTAVHSPRRTSRSGSHAAAMAFKDTSKTLMEPEVAIHQIRITFTSHNVRSLEKPCAGQRCKGKESQSERTSSDAYQGERECPGQEVEDDSWREDGEIRKHKLSEIALNMK